MIKTLIAHTTEIADPELAVSESGGQLLLTLAVLTSDDVLFSAGISQPLDANYETSLTGLYSETADKLPDEPRLMLTFAPLSNEISQDHFMRCLNKLSGGVPLFGMVAADYWVSRANPLVLFNGETYSASLGLILISGNVTPRFTFSGISGKRVIQRKTDEVRGYDFLLIVSCIARNFVLEWDHIAEIDCIRSRLGAAPFLFIYSFGEFCPVKTENGSLVNRFHNLTLVSCAF